MTDFAICLTCPEITTGRQDSSKGFLLDASSNHHHCNVKPLVNPGALPPPIRNSILRLGAGLPLTNNHITLLKLGLQIEDEWTTSQSTAPDAENTSGTSPADAQRSAASTKSRPASPPTSTTPAPSPAPELAGQMSIDFEEVVP